MSLGSGLIGTVPFPTEWPTPPSGSSTSVGSYFPASFFAGSYWPAGWSGGAPATTPEPAQVPTTLSRVLGSVVTKIRSDAAFSTANALVSLNPDFYPKSGTFYVVASPGDLEDVESTSSGGGRNASLEQTWFRVLVFLRADLDYSDEDEVALINDDESIAITTLAHKVKDLLSFFWPLDGTGNNLTVEPLRYRGTSLPVRNRRARQWIVSEVRFTVLLRTEYSGTC